MHIDKLTREKAMEKILKEYPMNEDLDKDKFDSDEEPDQEGNGQQDMQNYIRDLKG